MKHFFLIIALTLGLALYATDTVNPGWGIRSEYPAGNVGLASWYGLQHQGKTMANGKPFDGRALTTASRTLPLGSWIRVFNLRNGKSVDVQVTDRGPNKRLRGRILDLSEAAAKKLGFKREGLTAVTFLPLTMPTPNTGVASLSTRQP
jgi:rare lipoprotein A